MNKLLILFLFIISVQAFAGDGYLICEQNEDYIENGNDLIIEGHSEVGFLVNENGDELRINVRLENHTYTVNIYDASVASTSVKPMISYTVNGDFYHNYFQVSKSITCGWTD